MTAPTRSASPRTVPQPTVRLPYPVPVPSTDPRSDVTPAADVPTAIAEHIRRIGGGERTGNRTKGNQSAASASTPPTERYR